MRLNGIDAELLDREEVRAMVPILDFDNARFPIYGGLLQRRGGTARHDAVAWGLARAASARGVDIIQHCEVTGIRREGGRVTGVETTRGFIGANKIGIAVAGHTSQVAAMAGLRLPVESHLLQAFVSEAIKPMINCVVTFGAGHFYISQSDKGGLVFGGNLDGYASYAQRGNLPISEEVVSEGVAMIPALSRVRVLRQWAGIMDMTPDASPLICKTLVLRRLQGNSGLRLVLRPYSCHGRTARAQRGLHHRALSRRPHARREGRRSVLVGAVTMTRHHTRE